MSKIVFQEESLREVRGEMEELLSLHKEEVGLYPDKLTRNVVWEFYESLEDMGKLFFLCVRDDGVLIGYYLSFVDLHPHYGDALFGVNDILYLHKDYRKGLTGVRLIKEATKRLKERGVLVISIHMKVYADFSPILERLGWDFSEKLYTKYLGD